MISIFLQELFSSHVFIESSKFWAQFVDECNCYFFCRWSQSAVIQNMVPPKEYVSYIIAVIIIDLHVY